MKTKMTKMSLLLCTLMCCLWSAKGTISQSLYDIKPFHEPPGLYFENLGPAQLINSNWNMMVYYNLETYNAELKGIENFVNILSNKCTAKNEETNFCDTVLGQLKHQFLECEHNDKLIFDQTMHSRSKRSYFNIIGNVAHGLFGLLDNEFAEKYEEDIAKLKINQNHAQELIKKQTSITDATINLFRNNTNSVLKEFMKFEDRMKIQNNKTSAKEEVIALATATIIHMVGLQRVQSQILDMLTTIHHGRVGTSLLTPVQLKSQLDLINQNLPQYLMVPEGNNLLDIYKILSCKLSVSSRSIILAVNLPLVKKEYFQIFRVVPVPTMLQYKMVLIQPSTEYLITNWEKDSYHALNKDDLENCQKINDNMSICRINKPLYNLRSNISRCEIEILNHQANLSLCKIVRKSPTPTWIPLKGDQWIFAMEKKSTMEISCESKTINIELDGSGILYLNKTCRLKQPSMLISSIFDHESKISDDLMTQNNLSWEWAHQLKNIENTAILFNDTDNLAKQVKELQELQKESNVTEISGHHIHHYIVQYATIALIVLVIIYFINLKCKHNRVSNAQQTVV